MTGLRQELAMKMGKSCWRSSPKVPPMFPPQCLRQCGRHFGAGSFFIFDVNFDQVASIHLSEAAHGHHSPAGAGRQARSQRGAFAFGSFWVAASPWSSQREGVSKAAAIANQQSSNQEGHFLAG